jgi:hypothetical protein
MKYPDPGDPFVGIGIPQTIPPWIEIGTLCRRW